MSEEKKKSAPKTYVKNGVEHLIFKDEEISAFKPYVEALGGHSMSESEYHNIRETEKNEYIAKMREIKIRSATLDEEYKKQIMDQNTVNRILGKPLLPTPWLNRPSLKSEEENGDDYEETGFDEDSDDEFDEDRKLAEEMRQTEFFKEYEKWKDSIEEIDYNYYLQNASIFTERN